MPTTRLDDDEKEQILEHGIGVMDNIFYQLGMIYDQLRVKVLSMIAAQLALAGFIFSDWKLTLMTYGPDEWIIFGIAVLLQAIAMAMMLWILFPSRWSIPGSSSFYEAPNDDYDSHIEYLTKLHKDYKSCIDCVKAPIDKKSKAFTYVLYSLSLSVILLLVLKNGG